MGIRVEAQRRCPASVDLKLFGFFRLLPDVVWLGDGDEPYPEIESRERLTRRLLEIIARHACPVVIITSQPLILRDVDLLGEIAEQSQVSVVMLLSSLNLAGARLGDITDVPNTDQLETLGRLKRAGVHAGLGVYPQAPGINDDCEELEGLFRWTRLNNADFLFFPSLAFHLLLIPELYHSGLSLAAPDTPLTEDQQFTSSEFRSWRRSLSARLMALASDYNVPLRLRRPDFPGIYRENHWLAGRLADVAFYRRLQGRSFRLWLNTAEYLDRLDCDVRNILRYEAVENLKWVDQRVVESFIDLVSGRWSGREVPWQWLHDV